MVAVESASTVCSGVADTGICMSGGLVVVSIDEHATRDKRIIEKMDADKICFNVLIPP